MHENEAADAMDGYLLILTNKVAPCPCLTLSHTPTFSMAPSPLLPGRSTTSLTHSLNSHTAPAAPFCWTVRLSPEQPSSHVALQVRVPGSPVVHDREIEDGEIQYNR